MGSRKEPEPYRHKATRYYDASGNRVPPGTPGAEKRTETSRTYYANLKIGGKTKRTSLKTTDLATAWARLREMLRRERDRDLGIIDEYSENAEKPLSQHVEDWLASVESRGNGEKHLSGLRTRITRLIEVAGWKRITDLTADTLSATLARLGREGASAQTRNHYLGSARQFSRWAYGPGKRLKEDPFRSLRPANTLTDRRRLRRPPTDEELAKLFEYLEGERDGVIPPVLRGLSGRHRALCYRVSIATGLRANEMRQLTPACFDLDAGTLSLPASADKRRRPALLPLPPWLLEQLRAWFAAGGQCWDRVGKDDLGRLLRWDIEAAGIAHTIPDKEGRPLYLDFHSLRHRYCDWLSRVPGISPRALLALTRHSTVELAMGIYGRHRDDEGATVVAGMPEPGKKPPEKPQQSE